MASKMEIVIQNALRVFTKYIKKVPEFNQSDINELKLLTDDLGFADIQKLGGLLNSKGLKEFLDKKKTPMDYLPVYEDDCITVGVFLLSQGAKLPIHDHPGMYGIIKVLEGILKVTPYSFVELDKTVTKNKPLFYKNPLKVIKHEEIILDNTESSCLLTPTEMNIHEVECVVGPVAFLDILSPPYEEGSSNQPRVCHYFEEVRSEEDDGIRLVQIHLK